VLSPATSRQRDIAVQYEGPQCPRCGARLTTDWIRTGTIVCPDCDRPFEATAFNPAPPKLQIAEAVGTTVGETNACANHARNAATTNCARCGLFICALCDMNIGTGSYCPACFERIRSDGSLPTVAKKTRDYSAMARVSAIVGLLFVIAFVGPLFGILSLYYQSKARKQRREIGEDPWSAGMVFVMLLAILEIVGGGAMIVFLLYGLFFSK
jgi:ribosomal protein L37AE/L43A